MAGLFDGTSLERPVTCERCGAELADCACPKDAAGNAVLPSDQHPRVRREKRRGKWATVITGLDPDATDHKALLKELRTALGTGGGVTTVSNQGRYEQAIVLQGDHQTGAVERLVSMGYRAKQAGG